MCGVEGFFFFLLLMEKGEATSFNQLNLISDFSMSAHVKQKQCLSTLRRKMSEADVCRQRDCVCVKVAWPQPVCKTREG